MGVVVQGPWKPVDAATVAILPFAAHHGVTVRTVRRWLRDGLPHERDADGNPWFNIPASERWLDERRGGSADATAHSPR